MQHTTYIARPLVQSAENSPSLTTVEMTSEKQSYETETRLRPHNSNMIMSTQWGTVTSKYYREPSNNAHHICKTKSHDYFKSDIINVTFNEQSFQTKQQTSVDLEPRRSPSSCKSCQSSRWMLPYVTGAALEMRRSCTKTAATSQHNTIHTPSGTCQKRRKIIEKRRHRLTHLQLSLLWPQQQSSVNSTKLLCQFFTLLTLSSCHQHPPFTVVQDCCCVSWQAHQRLTLHSTDLSVIMKTY